MEEEQLTGEEFKDLVDVFRILRKWRDENNHLLSAEEPAEEKETENYL